MSIQFEIDGVIALLQLAHDSGLSFREWLKYYGTTEAEGE
jgi:hypothetical protein